MGIPGLIPGPLRPFAGVTVASDGSTYIAADGDGISRALAKGICNYSAQELRQVIGMKSAAVREILPRATDEAVHRDYLVLD